MIIVKGSAIHNAFQKR